MEDNAMSSEKSWMPGATRRDAMALISGAGAGARSAETRRHLAHLGSSQPRLLGRSKYFGKSEISQVQNSENRNNGFGQQDRARLEAGIARRAGSFRRLHFSRGGPGMRPGALARPARGLGPQPLDLASWQGDADLPDPFEFDPVDRLGVEAREVDQRGGFSPLDRLQITLAGLQPDCGLFPVEARRRMALFPVDHDNVAVFVFRQHGIADDFKGDGLLRDREGQLDLAQPFRRHLFMFGLDDCPGADAAHDRHRIQLEVIDDGRNFRGFDQASFGQDLGNRARADAHRRRQTALGLARLFKSPLDHSDIQHATIFLNFRKEINSDFPKLDLNLISEYQKLTEWSRQQPSSRN